MVGLGRCWAWRGAGPGPGERLPAGGRGVVQLEGPSAASPRPARREGHGPALKRQKVGWPVVKRAKRPHFSSPSGLLGAAGACERSWVRARRRGCSPSWSPAIRDALDQDLSAVRCCALWCVSATLQRCCV